MRLFILLSCLVTGLVVSSASLKAQTYPIHWVDLTGVTESGGVLTKTGAQGWTTGANGSNSIDPNADGWVEFTVTTERSFMVGLTDGEFFNYSRFTNGFNIGAGAGLITTYEGTTATTYGNVSSGDVFRVSREGSEVKYYRNGAVIRTVTVDPGLDLKVMGLIYYTGGTTPIVTASFDARIILQPAISGTGFTDGTGSISVAATGGTAPYTYNWSSGESTPTINNKNRGGYTLTVTDAENRTSSSTYSLGYKSYWDNLTDVTLDDGVLTKTSAVDWNAGANATNTLASNEDGWIEFVAERNSTYQVGFGNNATSFTNATFKNSLAVFHSSGIVVCYERSLGTTLGQWKPGDVFRIAREGSAVNYYKNGVLIRTVAEDPTLELYSKAVIHTGRASRVTTSFDSPLKVDAKVSGTGYADGTGNIDLTVTGGTAPYTYSWSGGESTSTISNKIRGVYSVSLTDAEGRVLSRDYHIGYKINYDELSPEISENDGILTKAAVPSGWNSGANGANILASNTNGWIEFIAGAGSGSTVYAVGFGRNFASHTQLDFRHGLAIYHTNGRVYSFENGSSSLLGIWKKGDVFRIEREGSVINYYQNGTVIKTTATDISLELPVKTVIHTGVAPKVNASFDSQIRIDADVTGTDIADGTGSISLVASGTTAPYTYSWSTGESTNTVNNKTRGTYNVTVADADGRTQSRTYAIGYKIRFTDLTNVTESDGVLVKTAPAGWDAGANGSNLLAPNTDGWIEFVAANGGTYGIGFAGNPGKFDALAFRNGLVLYHTTGFLYVYEGTNPILSGSWKPGDVFRIAREGNTINYYKNGYVIRSVAADPTLELWSKISLNSGPASPKVACSFDTQPAIGALVRGTDYADGTGSISLNVTGGTAPYTYNWAGGETTASVASKPRGVYSVTVTDADGRMQSNTYRVGFRSSYTNHTDATEAGGVLTKTTATTAWSAGAYTSNVLAPNTDGWVEFTAAASGTYTIGFAVSLSSFGLTTFSNALRLDGATSLLFVHEGSPSAALGGWKAGDVFRISREGNQMKYYRNGIQIRSVTVNPAAALRMKTALSSGSSPLVNTSFWIPASEGLVPDITEFNALKALYDSLGGPSWTNTTNWPTPGNWPATATAAQMGTWFGISVANGDVWKVIIPANNLTGKLPAAISQISEVSQIQLHNNHINGPLPSSLGSLGKLTWLRFETNQLTGQIPASLGNLSQLQHLYLSQNALSGSIPSSLGNLGNLIFLSLNDNQLTGSIPEELGNCSSLTRLYLFSNQLSGSIPPSLGNLSQLSYLYLRSNQLTGSLPPELCDLDNLEYLNLGSNQLSGSIPDSLGSLTKLQVLMLHNNAFTGAIPASLGKLKNLNHLYLYSNQLSGSIPAELGGLTKLELFHVYVNQLSGELPPALGKLTKLREFLAYTNQLTGTIPATFDSLLDLSVFHVSGNQLSGTLPDIFTPQSKLTVLNLSNNAFTGAFPASISNCALLTDISALNNKFTSLPASFLGMPAITRFNFNGNDLVSIPDFSSKVNKANLSLYLQNNYLDFSQLEPLINGGLGFISTPLTQKTINDVSVVALDASNGLTIHARPKGQFSTVTWERLVNNTWENVTALNEDPTGQTFRLTNGLSQIGRTFRWKMTNSKVVSVTLLSSSILVKETEGHLPDNIELAALKAIYDSLGGPNWTNNTNWPAPGNWPATATAAQMGTWHGVTEVDTDVKILDLASNNLVGTLPSAIGDLAQLETLILADNQISGAVPPSIAGAASLTQLDLSDNELTLVGDFTLSPNAASLQLALANNRLTLGDLEQNFTGASQHPFNTFTYTPQKHIITPDSLYAAPGSILTLPAKDPGVNGSVVWEFQAEGAATWQDLTAENEDNTQRTLKISDFQNVWAGLYRYRQTNTWLPDLTLESEPEVVYTDAIPDPLNDSTITYSIPPGMKVSREGRLPADPLCRQFLLSGLTTGDQKEVFQAPPCLDGEYYAGFQLYYDLGDEHTSQENWAAYVELTLYHGDDSLWTKPLRVDLQGQTFIATAFYDNLISCDDDYRVTVRRKQIEGLAPQDNIFLKILLYKKAGDGFDPADEVELDCALASSQKMNLCWSFAGVDAIEYDIEWVFIADHENFTGTTAKEAFRFKEPVRVSTAAQYYSYLSYYPDGRVWHRIRAVGYNPQFPDHRIPGQWFYSPCESIEVTNTDPTRNWQVQTVFAEEGKYKKVLNYLDGSLRQRQVQTNLSSHDVTLTGETLYDFEGRQSVSVLPVPDLAHAGNLLYRSAFNQFEARNNTVKEKTSAVRKKFNYDNHRLENSILTDANGAGWYYSPANNHNDLHTRMIPASEGYAFNQTEYLRDGTGRIARQSGVGKTFAQDGAHATRFYYGNVTQEELIRLFGSNAGLAGYYKKNLVVDPNGQVSVSYHDQQDRVIATALAGNKPDNVAALASYDSLSNTPVTVNISNKNERVGGISTTAHKLLNAAPNTNYTFRYDLSAYAARVTQDICQDCFFDLRITITDPEGALMDLSAAPGNQSPNGLSYVRTGITADNCDNPDAMSVEFDLLLAEIGDYTITKTLIPHEKTFTQMQEEVLQRASVQARVQAIKNSYVVDPAECEICTSNCPDEEAIINETIEEVATLDCENILNTIEQKLRDQHAENPDYEPAPEDIEADSLHCKYLLCSKNQPSDVFEKQMARVLDWNGAVAAGYGNPATLVNTRDPFFASSALSGYNAKSAMNGFLNNVFLATINNVEYRGTILQVTDPANTNFYIDASGNHNASGKHILYLDLMNRRAGMGEEAYQKALREQRWSMYKGFYLEAKRKTKLTIQEYKDCPKAKEELERPDNLPTTEEEIIAYGAANGVGGPVTRPEVEMSFFSIRHACNNANISEADSIAIANHLEAYFNGNPKNIFRLIFRHLLAQDEHLVAIDSILALYNCGLAAVAEDDPLSCLNDTTIIVNPPAPLSLQGGAAAMKMMQQDEVTEQKLKERKVVKLSREQWMGMMAKRKAGEQRELQQDLAKDSVASPGQKKHVVNEAQAKVMSGLLADLEGQLREEHVQRKRTVASGVETGIAPEQQDKTPYILPAEREKIWQEVMKAREEETDKLAQQRKKTSAPAKRTTLSANMDNQMGLMTTCVPDLLAEYNALMALYNATGGSFWNNKTGWGEPYPANVGNWFGVDTDAGGHVISINLHLNSLQGTLPSALGDLCKLETFDISWNSVAGTIPPTITNLTSLKVLNLSVNRFYTDFPSNIGALVNLETLDLSGNQFYGGIPVSIGALSNLTELKLHSNRLSGSIPTTIGDLSALQICRLSSNWLTGSIPSTIGNLDNMTDFIADNNQLSGAIPEEIDDCTSLTYISVVNNYLTGPLPAAFGLMPQLTHLYLYNNDINGEIPANFGNWNAATQIWLNGNLLTGSIPLSLVSSGATDIDLSSNRLSGAIPSAIQASTTGFRIGTNRFTFSDFLPVKQNFAGQATSFTYAPQDSVDVRKHLGIQNGAQLQLVADVDRSTSPASLYQWFRNGVAIPTPPAPDDHTYTDNSFSKDTDVGNYHYSITNPGAPDLTLRSRLQTVNYLCTPDLQAQHDALMALYNATNGTSWTNDGGWGDPNPASVGTWYGITTDVNGFITHLDLSGNNLTGTIPPVLDDLCSMLELDLSGNQLSGPIPVVISEMTNLEVLNLANNQLNGAIPAELGKLANLEVLDLSSNALSDEIPDEIGRLTNLLELRLADNQLEEEVPVQLGNLVNLTVLDLHSNKLYWLPSLSNLTHLKAVVLNNNQFWDFFAFDWDNLPELEMLSLSYNNFEDELPASIGNLTSLRHLMVDHNSITGELPSELASLTNLETLWINDNMLSGPIPVALGTLPSLSSFAVENNSFTFSDLLDVKNAYTGATFTYAPQRKVDDEANHLATPGDPFTFSANVDLATNPASQYQWFKDGVAIPDPSASLPSFTIPSVSASHAGVYHYTIINGGATDLVLTSQPQTLSACAFSEQGQYDALMALFNATNGAEWDYNDGWGEPFPADVGNWEGVYADDGVVKELYLSENNLTGTLPIELKNLCYLEYLYLDENQLSGNIPAIGGLPYLEVINLSENSLTGAIPASFGTLYSLEGLNLSENQLTGLPPEIGMLAHLSEIDISYNSLTGSIPATFVNLLSLEDLDLSNNQLTGSIPTGMGHIETFERMNLSNNQLTGSIPNDLVYMSTFEISDNQISGTIPPTLGTQAFDLVLRVDNNRLSGLIPSSIMRPYRFGGSIVGNMFTFSDLYDPFLEFRAEGPFNFHPQDSVDVRTKVVMQEGQPVTFVANVDRNVTYPCKYQWFKYVDGENDLPLTPQDFDSHTLIIPSVTEADLGKYYYTIINDDPNYPLEPIDLTLVSRFQEIVPPFTGEERTICIGYDPENPTLQKFRFTVNWNQVVQQCLEDAAKEDSVLIDYAIEKLVEEEVTAYYNNYSTKCLEGATETLTYAYVPKEYHYTLYYFDQAGSLTQTVPPKGVRPLSPAQVTAFRAGNKTEPAHTLVTQYQYNALSQLIWQKTPDAGESRFWYNDKSQIRLSQNAQQLKDSKYSYTRYDEQGRVVEVGEMNTTVALTQLQDSLASLNFPRQGDYVLTDITRTHYDFAKPNLEADFDQAFLRTRVAYVEVIEKDRPDTVATYYSYDIHGNVKALLQEIPGLAFKRTDYVYDLVSGKVNYVMYQYGEKDEFIHRYQYDSDNRLTDAYTSSDGFIWDEDANYSYYLHGPVARQEVGEYRLQGQDYYYTLQGWIKGVNGITTDPGEDGSTALVPKDVFAYNLGYYKDDYTAIGPGVTSTAFHLPMQAYTDLMGNEGLYNGNVAWMATDLKKIGQVKGNRLLGTQAMLYQYDQLHRIRQSRSLTQRDGAGAFSSRTVDPQAYDEDYSYDANGNLLTLHRLDENAALKDNFTYDYYRNTNKLKQLIPVVRDTCYSGAIASNFKVYENIDIKETAYIPAGSDVVLKAIENIDFPETFDVPDDANLHAYVLPEEEGVFLYDAIGNLIWDQEEGVKISWNPYGKVREVVKGDTTTIRFRYDGAGNRIEKAIIRTGKTVVTRYVRDASGNVMAVYNDTTLSEQAIYGSDRLGLYRSGRVAGHRTLGYKHYEFSNHLGNVLTVITDNIYMSTDSAWTNIVSTSDYYPFGLEMKGRTYSDTTYRYGFNGKEKDLKGEFGATHYDYGFRIYNPKIAKFLSVDPLTKEYPWYTPYQFAGNTPIQAIDIDGLEPYQMAHKFASNKDPKLNLFHADNVVDMANSTSPTSFNSLGWQRDPSYFWDNYKNTPLGKLSLSESNLKLIESGGTPIVDDQWNKVMKRFGNDGDIDEPIHHHHHNKGKNAIPIPQSKHTGAGLTKVNHGMEPRVGKVRQTFGGIRGVGNVISIGSIITDSPNSMLYTFYQVGMGHENRAYPSNDDNAPGAYVEWRWYNEEKTIREATFFNDYEKRDGSWRGKDEVGPKLYFNKKGEALPSAFVEKV